MKIQVITPGKGPERKADMGVCVIFTDGVPEPPRTNTKK
jgi:hypothetical protein